MDAFRRRHSRRRKPSDERGGKSNPLNSGGWFDQVALRYARLLDERRDVELTVAAVLLANPSRAIASARFSGVDSAKFSWPDTKIFADAIHRADRHGLLTGAAEDDAITTAAIAHRLLVKEHLWDPAEIPANRTSLVWSWRKLAWFIRSEIYAVSHLRCLACRLDAIAERLHEVNRVHAALMTLLLTEVPLPGEMAVAA